MAGEQSLPVPTRRFATTDEHGRDVSVPVWDDDLLGDITPGSDGVGIWRGYLYVTAEQVQAAGRALLAVAKHMRGASATSPTTTTTELEEN